VQGLSPRAKLVLVYLLTNEARTLAGIYRITARTVAQETDLAAEEVEAAFGELEAAGLARFDRERHVVWVVEALSGAARNGKTSANVARNLAAVADSPLVREFLARYPTDTLSIGYGYPMDTLSIGYGYPMDTLSIGYGYPMGEIETETESESESESETKTDPRPAASACVPQEESERPDLPTSDASGEEAGGSSEESSGGGGGPPAKGPRRSNTRAAPREDYPPEFEAFWAAYPRKVEKRAAFRAWRARVRERVPPEDLVRAASRYAAAVAGTEPRYIKHPSTFLGPNRPYEDWLKEGDDAEGGHLNRTGTAGSSRPGPASRYPMLCVLEGGLPPVRGP
jgi:hypothetical protein